MSKIWVLTLALAALTAAEGCKRNVPEPIPGPKAVPAVVGHANAAGIAWFQGNLDEAFARPAVHATCDAGRTPMAPLGADLSRPRNRLSPPPPSACRNGTCPSTAALRRPLV
jgi:hypothetical protein